MSVVTVTASVTETATLTDSGGNPLSGKTITFSHAVSGSGNFSQDGTASTNASGVATLTVQVTAPGTYDFEGVFAGDASYKNSTGTQTALIVKASTTIALVVSA